jgi:hypothetical protein
MDLGEGIVNDALAAPDLPDELEEEPDADPPLPAAKRSKPRRKKQSSVLAPPASKAAVPGPLGVSSPPTPQSQSACDGVEKFTIHSIQGCEHTCKGMQFDIVWQGHEHIKHWWQCLPEQEAFGELSQSSYHGRVLEIVTGEEKQGERLLAIVVDFIPTIDTWTIEYGDGDRETFCLHRAVFGPPNSPNTRKVQSWTLNNKFKSGTKTDSLLDWDRGDLAGVRESLRGFPTYKQAKHIVLAVREQVCYDLDEDEESSESLGQVCEWLTNPAQNMMMMTRFLCDSLRDDWLPGSVIRDAFQTMSGIEKRDLSKLQ